MVCVQTHLARDHPQRRLNQVLHVEEAQRPRNPAPGPIGIGEWVLICTFRFPHRGSSKIRIGAFSPDCRLRLAGPPVVPPEHSIPLNCMATISVSTTRARRIPLDRGRTFQMGPSRLKATHCLSTHRRNRRSSICAVESNSSGPASPGRLVRHCQKWLLADDLAVRISDHRHPQLRAHHVVRRIPDRVICTGPPA